MIRWRSSIPNKSCDNCDCFNAGEPHRTGTIQRGRECCASRRAFQNFAKFTERGNKRTSREERIDVTMTKMCTPSVRKYWNIWRETNEFFTATFREIVKYYFKVKFEED